MFFRRIYIAGFSAMLLLELWSCNSEVDILTNDYKTIPVISALINPWDSVHFIRVQRTFLIRDKEGAKLQDSDSLYFDQVDIKMSGILDEQEKFSCFFEKRTLEKDSGNFTGANHRVYQLNQKLPIHVLGEDTYTSGHPDIDYLSIEIYIHELDTLIKHRIPVYSPVHIY